MSDSLEQRKKLCESYLGQAIILTQWFLEYDELDYVERDGVWETWGIYNSSDGSKTDAVPNR